MKTKNNGRRKGKRFGDDNQTNFAKRVFGNEWNKVKDTPNGTRRVHIKNPNGHRNNPDS